MTSPIRTNPQPPATTQSSNGISAIRSSSLDDLTPPLVQTHLADPLHALNYSVRLCRLPSLPRATFNKWPRPRLLTAHTHSVRRVRANPDLPYRAYLNLTPRRAPRVSLLGSVLLGTPVSRAAALPLAWIIRPIARHRPSESLLDQGVPSPRIRCPRSIVLSLARSVCF